MQLDPRVIRNVLVILAPLVLDSCIQKSGEPSTDLHHHLAEAKDIVVSANEPIVPASAGVTICGYENNVSSLGIGVVLAPQAYTLWSDSATTAEFLSVSSSTEEVMGSICPKFYDPEYGIIHFVCIAVNADTYAVLADSATVKYIRRSTDGVEFKSWDEYILQSFGVRRKIDNEGHPKVSGLLRTEPEDRGSSLTIPAGHEMFCPMEVQGDWVKVRYDCFYNRDVNPYEGEPCHNFIEQCENPLTGWIRWRNGKELLIDIFLMP